MYFLVMKNLKLIVGYNPKVACTTIKILILRKLGHEIDVEKDVHKSELIRSLKNLNPKLNNVDLNSYTKICIVRNPYERLISGIRQRSGCLCDFNKGGDFSDNTITMFLQNLKKYNYIEHHFIPQTENINDFKFDHIIDVKDMSKLYSILGFEYKIEKLGGHATTYNNDSNDSNDSNDNNYHNLTIKDISNRSKNEWSNNIYYWFTKNDIKLINELYKKDFIFLKENGFDYEINI